MNAIKRIESVLIDFIAATTPWLAPLIPAYLVCNNMVGRLEYSPLFALIGAASVEFLGLSTVNTAVMFWQWNDNHKAERAPFWLAFFAGMFYVVIVLTVNAALDIWRDVDGVKIFAHAMLSLLSVDAAIIIAIRAQHARKLSEREAARQERKAANADANKTRTSANEREQNANEAPIITRDVFITKWQANGHKSIAALAHELGVNPRTAQKWVKSDAN